MATFVLIAGAWHGGWCWQRVRDRLRRLGHDVRTPSLAGLADRAGLLHPDLTLETHVREVSDLLETGNLSDVVLCGHSYGGVVMSGVADRQARRVGALAYVDALFPEDGDRVADLLPDAALQAVLAGAEAFGDGRRIPPASAAGYGLADPADVALVDRLSTPQPLRTFTQSLRLTGERDRIARQVFIHAVGWDGAAAISGSRARAIAKGIPIREFACGHEVMLDMPDRLTAELIELAGC